jgi:hypothetical protein
MQHDNPPTGDLGTSAAQYELPLAQTSSRIPPVPRPAGALAQRMNAVRQSQSHHASNQDSPPKTLGDCRSSDWLLRFREKTNYIGLTERTSENVGIQGVMHSLCQALMLAVGCKQRCCDLRNCQYAIVCVGFLFGGTSLAGVGNILNECYTRTY